MKGSVCLPAIPKLRDQMFETIFMLLQFWSQGTKQGLLLRPDSYPCYHHDLDSSALNHIPNDNHQDKTLQASTDDNSIAACSVYGREASLDSGIGALILSQPRGSSLRAILRGDGHSGLTVKAERFVQNKHAVPAKHPKRFKPPVSYAHFDSCSW